VFVNLSKILGALANPLSMALLLLLLAFWMRRRRVAWIPMLAAFLLLAGLGWQPVSDYLVNSMEGQYPDPGISGQPVAQAIVVLGGAVHGPGGRHPGSRLLDASDRLLVALRLYNAHKAPLVLCSGGKLISFSAPDEKPEAEVMQALLEEWGIPANAIVVESRSENTRQNATLSYQLLNPKGIRRILLVTSAMHMPRAAAVFRKAGFDVLPAPADFYAGWAETNPLDWIPNPNYLRRSEEALHEIVGLWVYRRLGWA